MAKSSGRLSDVMQDEKVDYWVVNMQDTIILELLADLRLWQSTSFACKYSLRFPRIHQIRYLLLQSVYSII